MKKLLAFVFALALATSVSAQEVEVGAASFVPPEGQSYQLDQLRALVSLQGLNLPLPGEAQAGMLVEAAWVDGRLEYSLWETNRTQIGRIIAGADCRVGVGTGQVAELDYDFRIVSGVQFGDVVAYVYFLNEDNPVGFAVTYRF